MFDEGTGDHAPQPRGWAAPFVRPARSTTLCPRQRQPTEPNLATAGTSPISMDGRADEIMDAVAEAVRPTDGTLDAESGREAVRDALSELLGRFPDADLLSLSEDQRVFAVERYLAFDVYNLFRLDVGKTIHDKALNATEALSRLGEVKDYLVESVSSRFRGLRGTHEQLTGRRVAELATRALQETFEVFEAYVT